MPKDIFCSIISREIPSHIVFENDDVLAFLDIQPFSKGHALIVPKQHYAEITDMPDDVIASIFKTARNVASAIKELYGFPGVMISQNNGILAEIPHVHVHVMGKDPADEAPLYKTLLVEEEVSAYLEETAKRLHGLLNQ